MLLPLHAHHQTRTDIYNQSLSLFLSHCHSNHEVRHQAEMYKNQTF